MTATTANPTPHQWDGEAPPTHWEVSWKEAIDAAGSMLPADVIGRLEAAASGRAIGAFDYGVAWGIGSLPDVPAESPPRVILAGIRAAMERVADLTAHLEEVMA